jgi:hypothetical protein
MPHSGAGSRARRVACYFELPRTPVPRTSVNKTIIELMGWEGFLKIERRQLRQRREEQLRRVLGDPLPGETDEQLDRIGEASVLRAEQGLVAVMGEDGSISYKPLTDLLRHDMHSRTSAERVEVGWLRERLECRRKGQDAPSIPPHLG